MQRVRRLPIRLSIALDILSEPPQIDGPPQIPLLRPNGQSPTTFGQVHVRFGLGGNAGTQEVDK